MCDYINSRQILLENMQILAEAPVTTRVAYFELICKDDISWNDLGLYQLLYGLNLNRLLSIFKFCFSLDVYIF